MSILLKKFLADKTKKTNDKTFIYTININFYFNSFEIYRSFFRSFKNKIYDIYRLFFYCSHISEWRQKSSLNPFSSPDGSFDSPNHQIFLENKIIEKNLFSIF
jgi:hypothetical protein